MFNAIALTAIFLVFITIANALSRRKMRAAPRITIAEVDRFWAEVNAASLPMAHIKLDTKAPTEAQQSRLGGTPFAGGQTWPVSPRDGKPMLFLAQINFADLPPLQDFPATGLLQLFVDCDDRGNLANTEGEDDRVLRWHPMPEGGETLPVPARFLDLRKAGTLSRRAVTEGLALSFKAGVAKGNPDNLPLCTRKPDSRAQLGETQEAQDALDLLDEKIEAIVDSYGTHWVGGHPCFDQDDPREDDGAPDRLLLHLGFDEDVSIGDSGSLNLMIRKEDLQKRDFNKAVCYWDCY